MSIVIRKLIEFFEKETGKQLSGKPFRVASGKEGDVIISVKGNKPFILKGVKKEDFYKFASIGDAMKIEKFLISAKVNERPTYYLVNVYGLFLYGLKKTYVCEGKPNLVEEGYFLKYKTYRFEGREYYYLQVNLEVTLRPKEGVTISFGQEEKVPITMEEYLHVLENYNPEQFLDKIEEMRREFEKRTISKDYLSMTKKEIAVSLMSEDENFKYRAWYCSRRGKLPKICENPFAYKAIAIYEQFYQGMKKLQIMVFKKESPMPKEI